MGTTRSSPCLRYSTDNHQCIKILKLNYFHHTRYSLIEKENGIILLFPTTLEFGSCRVNVLLLNHWLESKILLTVKQSFAAQVSGNYYFYQYYNIIILLLPGNILRLSTCRLHYNQQFKSHCYYVHLLVAAKSKRIKAFLSRMNQIS